MPTTVQHEQLVGSPIQFQVQPGRAVVPRGSVLSPNLKLRAVDLVSNTIGVTTIVDELALVKDVKVINAKPHRPGDRNHGSRYGRDQGHRKTVTIAELSTTTSRRILVAGTSAALFFSSGETRCSAIAVVRANDQTRSSTGRALGPDKDQSDDASTLNAGTVFALSGHSRST
jgi:hypothetical protein